MDKKEVINREETVPVCINPVSDILDCLPNKNDTVSPKNSPLANEKSESCYICSTDHEIIELIDCSICSTKGNNNFHELCLIFNEPLWMYKLNSKTWLCKKCRKQSCSKCLKDESQSEIAFRCSSCDVGYHKNCYESYTIKPMCKILKNGYICFPCIDVATKINPGEIDDDQDDYKDDDEPKPSTSETMCAPSKGNDNDLKNSHLYGSFNDELRHPNYPINKIPKILTWTEADVLEYLIKVLPQHVTDEVAKHHLDGRALLLINRSDIVSTKFDLRLGDALRLYKEVRILQTECTHNMVYWE